MAEHSKMLIFYEWMHKIVQYLSTLYTCATWLKHRRQECSTSICDNNYDFLCHFFKKKKVRTSHALTCRRREYTVHHQCIQWMYFLIYFPYAIISATSAWRVFHHENCELQILWHSFQILLLRCPALRITPSGDMSTKIGYECAFPILRNKTQCLYTWALRWSMLQSGKAHMNFNACVAFILSLQIFIHIYGGTFQTYFCCSVFLKENNLS